VIDQFRRTHADPPFGVADGSKQIISQATLIRPICADAVARSSASVGSLVGAATESVTDVESDAPQHDCDFVVEEGADVVDFSHLQAAR
jgi:hypothetical protein